MKDSKLTQADIDTIINVFQKALSDLTRKDSNDWLMHWTEDARLMPPDMADVVGHDALRQWMLEWPAIKRFDVIDTEVEGNGDLAVLICHFVRVREAPGGREIKQNARQVLKCRRQADGRWLIAAAIFNADHQSG